MNMLVCVKQVPDTTEIKIDPVTNTLIRQGVPSILNPFDTYALEAAARIKDKDPSAKIVVVCMGPEQAKAALKEALAIAADKAYLVSGRTFGGSDTLATSYILSQAIPRIEEKEGKFDFILCGKQAIDGDTGQVGPSIAEWLDLPQVTNALEATVDGDRLKISKEIEGGTEIIGVKLPCLATFTMPAWEVRYPTIKRKMAANKAEITVISDTDMDDIDKTKIGLKGSPTKVFKTFVPPRKQGGVKIEAATPEESVSKLVELMQKAGVI